MWVPIYPVLQPIYPVTLKADIFKRGPEWKKARQQVQPTVQASLPVGSDDPADPMMIEVSVADVGSLFQALTGESKHVSLGFQSKVLPSSVDNYYPFKKQLLAWYWALGKSEH